MEAESGTQMNCGGIARVRLRFVRIPQTVLTFKVSSELVVQPTNEYIGCVALDRWRDPVEDGLRQVYAAASLDYGIEATLLGVLIHLIDTNKYTSSHAGALALEYWLESKGKGPGPE